MYAKPFLAFIWCNCSLPPPKKKKKKTTVIPGPRLLKLQLFSDSEIVFKYVAVHFPELDLVSLA